MIKYTSAGNAVFNNECDTVKYAIDHPGHIVFFDKKFDGKTNPTAIFTVRTHCKSESYQIYVKYYYHTEAVVPNYSEYDFELCALYIADLNAIVKLRYSPVLDPDVVADKFERINSLNSLTKKVNLSIANFLIDKYAKPDNGVDMLSLSKDIVSEFKAEPIDFDTFEKFAHCQWEEFSEIIMSHLTRKVYAFDEVVDLIKDILNNNCQGLLEKKVNELMGEEKFYNDIVKTILRVRYLYYEIERISNDNNHKFNRLLHLKNNIGDKKSVLVTVWSTDGYEEEFRFKTSSFRFNSNMLNLYGLTDKELKRFREVTGTKYSDYSLDNPMVIQYNGRVIYDNTEN